MNEIRRSPGDQEQSQAMEDYFRALPTSCVPGLVDLISGNTGRRIDQMAPVFGLEPKDARVLVGSVNMINTNARTKAEAEETLRKTFMRGTDGGQSTGSVQGDKNVVNGAKFVKMYNDGFWKVREQSQRRRGE